MKRAIIFIFFVCESRSRYISTESKLKVIPKGSSSVGKVDWVKWSKRDKAVACILSK